MVALEAVGQFRDLNRDEMNALRQITQERHFAAGRQIFKEGESADGVYVVKDGRVEISGVLGGAAPRVFSRLGPGEIFGEMAVIEHRPRSATATASTDTDVYFIPRGEMLHLIGRSAGLAFSLLQEISHRLRDFNRVYLNEVVQAERLAAIGRFTRGIVHDLKNPLNIIGLSAEMASLPNSTPDLRARAHERIRRQVERINDLVGEILLFTQGTPAAVTLSPTDYSAFVGQVLEELRQEINLKSVRLELASPPPPVGLVIDPKRLRRVFFNLAHNAIEAMSGSGSIVLRFRQSAKEVVTEMEDTGPGVAPEIAGRLFEAFATHGKAHGTGLGLSICRKIVEDHGGRIWAQTEAGRGAVFAFALPIPK